MKQAVYSFGFVCILLSFIACGDQSDSSAHLRSLNTAINYSINNKEAAMRLFSVMYNRADTARPVERFKVVHISDAHLSSYSSSNNHNNPNNLLEAIRFSNQQELAINTIVATGDRSYITSGSHI